MGAGGVAVGVQACAAQVGKDMGGDVAVVDCGILRATSLSSCATMRETMVEPMAV